MKFTNRFNITAILFLLGFGSAHAGLITIGELSRDETTNIVKQGTDKEWLMWSESDSFTDAELNILFTTGSINGWKLANKDDVIGLFQSAGFNIRNTDGLINTTYDNVVYSGDDVISGALDTQTSVHFNYEFFNIMGESGYLTNPHLNNGYDWLTAFFDIGNGMLGHTATSITHNNHHERVMFYGETRFIWSKEDTIANGFIRDGDGEGASVALYRVTQVPEPTTVSILAIGLLSLASRRHKKTLLRNR